MANAIVDKNPDAVLKHVSKDFKYGRLGREELFKLVDASVRSHNVEYVKLWDKQIVVNGDIADVRFNFRADTKGGQQYPASAQAKFARENGQWKLCEVHVFKLGTTERQYIPGVD
jgi:ketosteroid isomerase-like protein